MEVTAQHDRLRGSLSFNGCLVCSIECCLGCSICDLGSGSRSGRGCLNLIMCSFFLFLCRLNISLQFFDEFLFSF